MWWCEKKSNANHQNMVIYMFAFGKMPHWGAAAPGENRAVMGV